jgi:hypothetical protein
MYAIELETYVYINRFKLKLQSNGHWVEAPFVQTNYMYSFISLFEDTKGVIRICNTKDRQHNGEKKKDKQRSTEN